MSLSPDERFIPHPYPVSRILTFAFVTALRRETVLLNRSCYSKLVKLLLSYKITGAHPSKRIAYI